MSRIDELISEQCPDGVEFRSIASASTVVRMPGKVNREDYGRGARFPIVDQSLDFIAGYTDESTLVVPQGEYVVFGDHTRAVKFIDFAFAQGADGVKVLQGSEGLSTRWLYYCLSNLEVPSRGYNRHWTLLRDLRIPVPPAHVQEEIIAILDVFTSLEAELEAELGARRLQYAHYRQAILDHVAGNDMPLSNLGRWQGGMTPSKGNPAYWESGTIPWLASMDVSDSSTDDIRGRVTELALEKTPLRLVRAPSVAVVMRSNILRRRLPIGLINVDTTVNQDMRVLAPREGVDAEYVFQALVAQSEQIRSVCVRTDGSMAAVDSQKFFDWRIPLPSFAEQRRVAEKLRYFDTLVNDLSTGLPAEIKARRQQYEYYRDHLLTFKQAV